MHDQDMQLLNLCNVCLRYMCACGAGNVQCVYVRWTWQGVCGRPVQGLSLKWIFACCFCQVGNCVKVAVCKVLCVK